MLRSERDQAAEDLVLDARSIGDEAEIAAWGVLLAVPMPSGPEIVRVRRALACVTEGKAPPDGLRSRDPSGLSPTDRLLRAAAGMTEIRGAVLDPASKSSARAILRGKVPVAPPPLLVEALKAAGGAAE